MLTRSTGLGSTQLEGSIETLEIKGDYVILGSKTYEPVKWHVRTALSLGEMITVARLLLLTWRGWGFVLKQLVKIIIRPFKKDKSLIRPDDF